MSKILSVRFNEDEWNSLEKKSKEQKLSKSEYARRVLAEGGVNSQKYTSNKVIRDLSEVQMAVDALKRKHSNINFATIEEKLEEAIYELCEEY